MYTQLSAALANLTTALVFLSTAMAQTYVPPPHVDIWQGYGLLKRICAVESNRADPNNQPRQFEDDGVTPLWGREKDPVTKKTIIVKRDVGACQINTDKWLKTATRMGLDVVNSYDDNIVFAKWLYDRYGWTPWKASKDSWSRAD